MWSILSSKHLPDLVHVNAGLAEEIMSPITTSQLYVIYQIVSLIRPTRMICKMQFSKHPVTRMYSP